MVHKKLYAVNLRVRFDEGEVASVVIPRRGSMFYKGKNRMMQRLVNVFFLLLTAVIPLGAGAVIEISNDYSYNGDYVYYLNQPAYRLPASGVTVSAKHEDERTTYHIQVPSDRRATVSITFTSKGASNQKGFLVVRNANTDWEGQYNVGDTYSSTFTSSVNLELRAYCTGTYSGSNISELKCYYDTHVTYESTLPDLMVSSLSLSESEMAVGDTVTLSYTVKNSGGKSAAPSTAYVYDGDSQIRTVSIPELAQGTSYSSTLNMSGISAGNHVFKIVADALNVVEESNETNNGSTAVALVVYERGATYTVEFDANGGVGTMSPQSFACGEKKPLDKCVFTSGDKVFRGWATEPSGNVAYADEAEVSNLTFANGGRVVLYAVWDDRMTIENGVLIRVVADGLEEFAIPDAVTSIGEKAFENCTSLKRITIPSSVTNICPRAFLNCTSLGDVMVPTNVLEIGYYAFDGCISLTNMVLPFVGRCRGKEYPQAKYASSSYAPFCWIFRDAGNITDGYVRVWHFLNTYCGYYMPKSLKSVIITDDFEIGYGAFSGCPLTKIVLPERDCEIGEWAFRECNELKDIRIPENTHIGDHAFADCQNLETATIAQQGSVELGRWAFSNCPKLTSLSLFASNVEHSESNPYASSASVVHYVTASWEGPSDNWRDRPVELRDTVEVAFDANGGVGDMKPQRFFVDLRQQLKPNAFERKGFVFRGWAVVPDGDVAYTDTQLAVFSSCQTLYAVWESVRFRVVFDANGGEGGWSHSMSYGAAITAPTVTREGYTFTGWSPDVTATVPASNVTYTAQWLVNQYTVTFDANGGEGGTTTTLDYRTAVAAPTVAREGYTFAGWLPDLVATVPACDVTYTAQWTVMPVSNPDPEPVPTPLLILILLCRSRFGR